MWSKLRCLWINFVRIKNYLIDAEEERTSNAVEKAKKRCVDSIFNSFWTFCQLIQTVCTKVRTKNGYTVICKRISKIDFSEGTPQYIIDADAEF